MYDGESGNLGMAVGRDTSGQNFFVPLKTCRTKPTAPFKSQRKYLRMIQISALYDRGIRS